MLKVGSPTQRLENERNEAHALRLCNGKGTVKLLGYDEELGVLMLERAVPGVSLSVGTDDVENTRIACRMMKAFWQPLPEAHNFRPVSYEIEGFAKLRKKHHGTTGPLPEKWVLRTEALYEELMSTSTRSVVLHGDLHHYNILSAQREPWLVIDPKGYFGDPGFDVGPFLANYPEASCEGRDPNEIDVSRINVMIEELDMPGDRVIKWGIVQACIWARWSSDTPDEKWRGDIRRAEVLDGML